MYIYNDDISVYVRIPITKRNQLRECSLTFEELLFVVVVICDLERLANLAAKQQLKTSICCMLSTSSIYFFLCRFVQLLSYGNTIYPASHNDERGI